MEDGVYLHSIRQVQLIYPLFQNPFNCETAQVFLVEFARGSLGSNIMGV